MTPTTPPQPWQTRQPSYGVKLLLLLGFAILAIIALSGLAVVIFSLISFTQSSPNPGSNTIALLVGAALLAASGFGIAKVFPLIRTPTGFTPSYGRIAPETVAHPFEVRYVRVGLGRTMTGKGTLRFADDALHLEGWRSPNPLIQIGIVLALTYIPLVVLKVGLGLLPALIIAHYVGRKRLSFAIPYRELQQLRLDGCRLSLGLPAGPPHTATLYTAAVDGERLHREVGVPRRR